MSAQTQTVEGVSTDRPGAGAAAYAVGRNRPPLHSRWRKGVSGNPLGRPRRPAFARRGLPPIPALERALARPVETAYQGEGHQAVSLAEMLVNELTQMVTVRHSVAAARELMHWIAEVECARAEREAEAAEEAEEARLAEEAAREAEAAKARAREELAQREAYERLRALAGDHYEHCDGDCEGACFDGAADDEGKDEHLFDRAVMRLGVGALDDEGELKLKPWVIEAALARAPDDPLDEADRAALALAALSEPGEDGSRTPDWAARLEGVRDAP